MGSQKPPQLRRGREIGAVKSSSGDIAAFLETARSVARAGEGRRLVLALDATMSRQPTWDVACTLQAKMFEAVAKTGGLAVQLVYFRGYDECRSSRFVADARALKDLMVRIQCRGGETQIAKVLSHTLKENERAPVSALVFIGDAMEEGVDLLCRHAGELGLRGVPVFVFQEGVDKKAETAFREIARLSRGAWFRFDSASPDALGKLLSSIAVYASGGRDALRLRGTASDRKLLDHLG